METSKTRDKARDKHGSSSSKSSKSSRRRASSSSSGSPPPVRRRHGDSDDERPPSKSSKQHHDDNKASSKRPSGSSKQQREPERHKRENSPKKSSGDFAPSSSSNGDVSLSIEETNALRAKLGLKPLTSSENKPVTQTSADKDDAKSGKKTYIDKDTNQEFEHAPAKNLARLKEEKELREKLAEQKEKRQLTQKIATVKGLADSDDEDSNDAHNWVRKLKEKEAAQRKAKLLEEMDEQFDSVAASTSVKSAKSMQTRGKEYTAKDLKGLRVQHDQDFIQEGQEVILTLQDQYILKGAGNDMDVGDDEDVLVNVNVLDAERAAKNLENKKTKPVYRPFDDGFDEDGNFVQRGLLDKYDEELEGQKKKSFKLGAAGVYDASDSKFIRQMNEEHKARAVNLDILNEFKVASDYYSQQELEKFKKPKKIRKVLRSKKALKADDLLPLPTEPKAPSLAGVKAEKTEVKAEPEEPTSTTKATNGGAKKISIKDIDFGEKSDQSEDEESDDEYDVKEEDVEGLKEIIEEENNLLDELHSVLNKTRQRITSSIQNTQQLVKKEPEAEEASANGGVAFDRLNTIADAEEGGGATLVLDTMSEFCRNLGNDTSSAKYMKELDEDEAEEMVVEKKKPSRSRQDESDSEDAKEHSRNDDDDDDVDGDDMDVSKSGGGSESESEDGDEKETENFGLLEDEPAIDRGLASALKLAVNKGFLEEKAEKKKMRPSAKAIEAVNYTVEEKNYYDIDDKYNRNRDRGGDRDRFAGPLSEFEEKRNYKPDVKLDYIDDKGHAMNEKEAFRYLSHRFHGKGSGKRKTEKRQKKIKELEAMNKMSSGDTPLNTVALLREKQMKLQQPYVVLSTPKGKNDQVTLHKR